MTQAGSRPVPGNPALLNPKLQVLLESGEFDWDNPRHREAWLRAWLAGASPAPYRTDEDRSR